MIRPEGIKINTYFLKGSISRILNKKQDIFCRLSNYYFKLAVEDVIVALAGSESQKFGLQKTQKICAKKDSFLGIDHHRVANWSEALFLAFCFDS